MFAKPTPAAYDDSRRARRLARRRARLWSLSDAIDHAEDQAEAADEAGLPKVARVYRRLVGDLVRFIPGGER